MAYTWSFADVVSTITGPGGSVTLGNGSGAAAEGITFAHADEKDTMSTGADGTIMHSLHASMTGRITVRLLRTSPQNALLNQLYNFQRSNSGNWGQNTLTLGNVVIGDNIAATQVAFMKHPDVPFATEGGTLDWEFGGFIVPELGDGIPGLAAPTIT